MIKPIKANNTTVTMVTSTKMLPGIFSSLNRSSTSGPAVKPVRHWRVSWITLWMWVVRVFSLALKLTKNRYFLVTSETAGVSRRVFSRVSCFSSPVHFANGETRYMSSEPKRLCTENMTVTKIGTHNGTFHCDEVLACFFLRQLPEYSVGAARCRLIETCLGLLLTPRCALNFF